MARDVVVYFECRLDGNMPLEQAVESGVEGRRRARAMFLLVCGAY
jgi:hypothetical protein